MHTKFPDEACRVGMARYLLFLFFFLEQASIIKFLQFVEAEFPAPDGVSEAQRGSYVISLFDAKQSL